MAFLLMNAHNIIDSCCHMAGNGSAGNIFAKLFKKVDEHVDQNQTSTAAAAGAANPFGGKKFGFTDKQAKYEDVPWSKLPLSARKAAKVIGFEEKSWDNKEWLDIEDYHWAELSSEQRTACETLGWDHDSWDNKYEHKHWSDLPAHVKLAAEKLGWNKEKWDDDWDVPSWEKEWTEFTPEEQRCLHVLGYYVHTWD